MIQNFLLDKCFDLNNEYCQSNDWHLEKYIPKIWLKSSRPTSTISESLLAVNSSVCNF